MLRKSKKELYEPVERGLFYLPTSCAEAGKLLQAFGDRGDTKAGAGERGVGGAH
jgi:hypothetical protein